MTHFSRTLQAVVLIATGLFLTGCAHVQVRDPRTPNILLIYADDLGFGDASCYGATRVQTPNIDRLAREGLRFTDAHTTSSTCTPSRYSMLTGEYAWRKRGTGVLPGDAPLIIEPGRTTMRERLAKGAGYTTGVIVGKWHLGLGGGGPRLERRHQARPARTRLRLLLSHARDRRPRAVRVCGESSRHRTRGGRSAEGQFRRIHRRRTDRQRDIPSCCKVHPSHGHDFRRSTMVSAASAT